MLNVSYADRFGYYTLVQQGRKYKIWICRANCICAMVRFYKDEQGTDMVQLQGWFADLTHAKRCIKDGFFKGCGNFVFYANQMNGDMWKVVKAMTEQGIKVTIK